MEDKQLRSYLDRVRDAQTQITTTMNDLYSDLNESKEESISAKEFIDIIAPEHCRTSCSDKVHYNGLYSSEGYTRCIKCTLLQILQEGKKPESHAIVGFCIDIEEAKKEKKGLIL